MTDYTLQNRRDISDRVRCFGVEIHRLYSGRLVPGSIYRTGDQSIADCRERGGEDEAAQMAALVAELRAEYPDWQAAEIRGNSERFVAFAHSTNDGSVAISAEEVRRLATRR